MSILLAANEVSNALINYALLQSLAQEVGANADDVIAKYQQILSLSNQVDANAELAQSAKEEAVSASALLVSQWDDKGDWNPATNTPVLTSVPSAHKTGEKWPMYSVPVGGNLPFPIKGRPINTSLPAGYIVGHPIEDVWYWMPPPGGAFISSAGNLPWTPVTTNIYGAEMRAAIKDIWLFNVDRTKQYFIAVFAKKPSGSTQYVIHIHQQNAVGSQAVMVMEASGYVPSSNPDIIRLQGPGDMFAVLTVDWNALPDGYAVTNMTTSHGGISLLRYISLEDWTPYVNKKFETMPLVRSVLQPPVLSRVDAPVLSNNAARTITHGNISALRIFFKTQDLSFDTFSFPGHNFTHTSAKYAFCVVKVGSGLPMLSIQPFDKRTTDYVFILGRKFNLNESVSVTFGYMNELGQSFAPGVNIGLGIGVTDANLSTTTIYYLNQVQSVFSTGIAASTGWFATAYKISLTSELVTGPTDNTAEINNQLSTLATSKTAIQPKILRRTDSMVLQNTNARTIAHANISAIILSFTSQDKNFDTFSFPGHNFSNPNAVYAFCLIRPANGAPMMHIQYFDKRTTDYVFILSRMVNLKENIKITFGYLGEDGQSFAPGVGLGWGSATADANMAASSFSYLNMVSDPYSSGLVTPAGWVSSQYKLSTSSDVVFVPAERTQMAMKFVLPAKLYPLTDSQLWLYSNGMIKNDQLFQDKRHGVRLTSRLVSNSSVVTNYLYDDEFSIINGTTGATNTTFELVDRMIANDTVIYTDKPTVVATKVVQVQTPKIRPTNKTWNAIFIGDSFEDSAWQGVGMLQKISDFAAVNSNAINWRGTRTPNYGGGIIKSEARGSWSENTFFRYVPVANRSSVQAGENPNLHSPFMFSPDDTAANAYFSFLEYMNTYGTDYGALDFVIIALGTNPGSSPAGSKINEMIASIRIYNPALSIIVCTVAPASVSRRNMDCPMDQLRKIEQTEAYLTLFDNRDAQAIYVCPWHAMVHRLYGLQNAVINVAKFADRNRVDPQLYESGVKMPNIGEQQTKLVLSDQHPSDQGIHTYADGIYELMCYIKGS
jgi:hypothetical protein